MSIKSVMIDLLEVVRNLVDAGLNPLIAGICMHFYMGRVRRVAHFLSARNMDASAKDERIRIQRLGVFEGDE